ncbi:MAG: MFS transporter, partial [Actinomycetes bacterium]
RGLGPLASGAVFTSVALPDLAATRSAVRVLTRVGPRAGIAGAALTFGAGHVLLLAAVAEIGTGGSVLWMVPGLAVGGVGMGVTLSGLVGTVMASVPPQHAGIVSGTSSTLQQVANAVGVALVGIIFFGRVDHGMVDAFEASLVYLVATTVAVAVAAVFLPGRPKPAADRHEGHGQELAVATSSSAAA